jgi:KDO2-lipid IV(A) lauroyltransferase
VSLREDGARLTAVYWGYRALERTAMALPERVGRRVFAWLGRVALRMLPGVRATVTANQAQVLGLDPGSPIARSAAREAFELYARYWYDTFRIRALPPDEIERRTRFEGLEHIDAALEAGRGCIAVLPHMGNWDLAGHYMAVHGYPLASVAEVLRPPRLFELFLRHREELGMRIVPLKEGTHVGQQLAGLLADNWVVALVADRDLSGGGVEVEMFGATRRVPAGPAMLALSTGAPVVVCPAYTTPDGWVVRIDPPLEVERTGRLREDVAALSRLMAAGFERAIAARPPDWHMFQPGWPP